MATGSTKNSGGAGARPGATLQLVRDEPDSHALPNAPAAQPEQPGVWAEFRKRIRRGEFLSTAAHRSRRQRRVTQRRRWFHVSAIVAPLVCLAGTLALVLAMYADTYATTEELRQRVAEVETQADQLARPQSFEPAARDFDERPVAASTPVKHHEPEYFSTSAAIGEYTVRRRDNLWTVVKRECGLEGDLIAPAVEYIKQLNGIQNVKRMQPGDRILLPSRDQLMRVAGAGLAPEQP